MSTEQEQQQQHEHGAPVDGAECICCMEDLDAGNYVEWRAAAGAFICPDCLTVHSLLVYMYVFVMVCVGGGADGRTTRVVGGRGCVRAFVWMWMWVYRVTDAAAAFVDSHDHSHVHMHAYADARPNSLLIYFCIHMRIHTQTGPGSRAPTARCAWRRCWRGSGRTIRRCVV